VRFLNQYRCVCGEEWEDVWSCACDDRCPVCRTEMEPYRSVVLAPDDSESGDVQLTRHIEARAGIRTEA